MNAYILVGGQSTRMGESKVRLFLPRVVAAARPVFDSVIAVQRAGGERAEIETIFEEEHDERAPAFGVARAIEHANRDCFILAVDYPLIAADVLRYIAERFGVPRWDGKLQMLCAPYRASAGAVIRERIAAGRYDLRGLVDSAQIIEEDEMRARFPGEPLMNVNTPDEWERAKTFL